MCPKWFCADPERCTRRSGLRVRTGVVVPTRVGAWVAPAVERHRDEPGGDWVAWALVLAAAVAWVLWCTL
jgi:hypothetical protein